MSQAASGRRFRIWIRVRRNPRVSLVNPAPSLPLDSLAHLETAELVARLRDSDRAAFGEIFDRFHQPLFRYAARIVSREDALDVTQEVFAQLWEIRGALAIRVSLKSLLYRMTRNRSLNVKRKLKRIDLPGDLPERAAPSDDSDRALQAALRVWIDQLPPRRAEAFTLSRYHDLSHEQISRIMGLSIRTVQTHIVHALRDLRARMETWNRAASAAELP